MTDGGDDSQAQVHVLYVTYDGLTDPLGRSQILPYLTGCARAGYAITIVSFEKKARRDQFEAEVSAICEAEGMRWRPQRFRSSPPYLSKYLDQRTMAAAAFRAATSERFDIVHCRSYPSAVVGLHLKRRFGMKLIFDMRGFWPDQRREGGRWKETSLLGSLLFRQWKQHEADLVRNADHIVSLTHAAADVMQTWPAYSGAPISIIPCCADFEIYKPSTDEERMAARKALGIPADAPTLAYLGSIGTVYLVREQLRLFDAVRRRDSRAMMLFVGNNSPTQILEAAAAIGVALSDKDFRIVSAEREQVAHWISAADVGICFCVPSFSSLGVSPTKLAEYLACGVPAIANRGVGDVEQILADIQAGHVLADFSDANMQAGADAFFELATIDRQAMRERSRPILDLPVAVAAYIQTYKSLSALIEAHR